MEIGNTMRTMREERGMKLSALAKELGITRSALWKIETKKSEPKASTVKRFCQYMKCPIAFLYISSMSILDFCPPE